MNLVWVPSDECQTKEGAAKHLADVDAVCVPGGFGIRGIEGKVGALEYARTHGIPTLGLCLGLQCMVIEYARHVAGIENADSTEFDTDCAQPVIATMAEQKHVVAGEGDLGGTMRLGLYPAELKEGTVVRETYGEPKVEERHRHRYEVNNAYRAGSRRPAWCSRAPRPTTTWSSSSSFPRGAPVLRLHPGAPRAALARRARTRCSRGSSARPSRQRELRFPIDESTLRRHDVDGDAANDAAASVEA